MFRDIVDILIFVVIIGLVLIVIRVIIMVFKGEILMMKLRVMGFLVEYNLLNILVIF